MSNIFFVYDDHLYDHEQAYLKQQEEESLRSKCDFFKAEN